MEREARLPSQGTVMPSGPVNPQLANVSASTIWHVPKTVWHPLSLQQLQPSQFIGVVNKILDGQYELVSETLQGVSASDEARPRGRIHAKSRNPLIRSGPSQHRGYASHRFTQCLIPRARVHLRRCNMLMAQRP